MNNLLSNVDTMTATGKELITQTEGLSEVMQKQIAVPVQEMMKNGQELMKILSAVTTQLETISADSEAAVSQGKKKLLSVK